MAKCNQLTFLPFKGLIRNYGGITRSGFEDCVRVVHFWPMWKLGKIGEVFEWSYQVRPDLLLAGPLRELGH